MGILADLRSGAADLVAGTSCVGCGRPGRSLCAPCATDLSARPFRASLDPPPPGLPRVWAAAGYDGVVRAALLAHKERSCLALTPVLGLALARSVAACLAAAERGRDVATGSSALLVPVPARRAVVQARGHDPVRRMALRAAAALRGVGLDVGVASMLRVGRAVRDQSELGSDERRANLLGAMRPTASAVRWDGRPVVVVDDIVTTGATAAECVRALTASGVSPAGAAVVAATRLRREPA